ncbi:hypothetical protein DSO57_1011046 [Entomophthora muscae]|uniref:Uncharacterized protein n=1 Tax=Entomophthora muscae TaxID=34485 RepID=A0ACC2RXF6_9FUNG|nr:hypothetical protein DSO57_1011046 [Entomophthora muscae]
MKSLQSWGLNSNESLANIPAELFTLPHTLLNSPFLSGQFQADSFKPNTLFNMERSGSSINPEDRSTMDQSIKLYNSFEEQRAFNNLASFYSISKEDYMAPQSGVFLKKCNQRNKRPPRGQPSSQLSATRGF